MFFKLKVAAISTIVIVTVLFMAHYGFLLHQNSKLASEIKTKNAVIDVQTEAIKEWQKSAEVYQKQVEAMAQQNKKALKEFRELSDVFAKHNLTSLANAKPKLIENRINSGTISTLRLLECATDRSCKTREATPARPDTDNNSNF